MRRFTPFGVLRAFSTSLWLTLLTLLAPAQAHLMLAQHGTLNIVGDGAYLVLSLPVSAFLGMDNDGDGRLSAAELRAHRAAIEAAVQHGVVLSDDSGPRPLQGLMLNLSAADEAPAAPAPQLVLLGRYALAANAGPLRFSLQLYGREIAEREFSILVTRGDEKQVLALRPWRAQADVLPAPWQALRGVLARGIERLRQFVSI